MSFVLMYCYFHFDMDNLFSLSSVLFSSLAFPFMIFDIWFGNKLVVYFGKKK